MLASENVLTIWDCGIILKEDVESKFGLWDVPVPSGRPRSELFSSVPAVPFQEQHAD